MIRGRLHSVLGVLALLALIASGCSDDDDAGDAADPTEATTSAPADTDDEGDPAADGPATRHVIVALYDGLQPSTLDLPEGDFFALLAEVGAAGTVTAGTPGPDGCIDPWVQAMRAGGEPDGAHLFDAIAEAGDTDLGLFTTSSAVAESLAPETDATVAVGEADLPGLDPWPATRLAVDATRTEAILHVSEATGDSVTVLHLDVLPRAASDPNAATVASIAVQTSDDLLDILVSAADARPTRPNEDWLFVTAGACGDEPEAPFLVEGDGVAQPSDLGSIAAGHASVGSIVLTHLGVTDEAWPAEATEAVFEGAGE